jgi:hypothetical protein
VIGFAQLGSITFSTGAEPALALDSQSRSHSHGLEIMNEPAEQPDHEQVDEAKTTSPEGRSPGQMLCTTSGAQ